jgi:hypothetical protein
MTYVIFLAIGYVLRQVQPDLIDLAKKGYTAYQASKKPPAPPAV